MAEIALDRGQESVGHAQWFHRVSGPGWMGMGVRQLCLVFLSASFALASVYSQDAGVQIGDHARWAVETVWSSNLSGEKPTVLVNFTQGVEVLEATVRWVASTSVRYDLTARFRSGAARTPVPYQDLSSGDLGGSVSDLSREGIPGLGMSFILSGLDPGDAFGFWWRGDSRSSRVESVETRSYAGGLRQVCVATYASASHNLTEMLVAVWDRATGILCEATLIWSTPTSTTKTALRIIDTNRWGLAQSRNMVILLPVMLSALFIGIYLWRRRIRS